MGVEWKISRKKDHNPASSKVFGNRLDYIIRQSQDSQTMGIPVGPDHSRVTSEIILASVDKIYRRMEHNGSFLRHVDDVWIGRDSAAECEHSLHCIRKALNDFSLDINELTTRIVRTSLVISENWPYDLEAQLEAALKLDATLYEGRIVSLLGTIIETASSDRDDGVIKFFLRRMDAWKKWDDYWDILEPFLAHCAIQFPHSLDYVAQIISWRIRTFRDYDESVWKAVTLKVIGLAATTGRDSEAAWGLWLAKEVGLQLPKDVFERLCTNVNPLVAAFLVAFVVNGRVQGGPKLGGLWDRIDAQPLTGETWPLALQLNHEGIRRPKRISLDGPDQSKAIFDSHCSIIEWDARPSAFVGQDDQPDDEPDSALRFSGSGYDSDDDEEEENEEDFPF